MMRGRFFEDFTIGEDIVHATPRTLIEGDASLYVALYGSRFAHHSSAPFARALGYAGKPLDDLLVFHTVFGKTVPDISLNAVANLGYADCRFGVPVYAGDTLSASSTVIGLKENSNGKTGIVTVRTQGRNERDELVLSYIRWVMVHKRDPKSPAPEPVAPDLPAYVDPATLTPPPCGMFDFAQSGSAKRFDDYAEGLVIDHHDGVTVEEAEHQLATRLYQNTARVHFDGELAKTNRFGKRLIYGGHVLSIARALSFNGLENAYAILAINAGAHTAPLFAEDTVSAKTEVMGGAVLNDQVGALRLKLVAHKNRTADDPGTVILDFDLWAAIPR